MPNFKPHCFKLAVQLMIPKAQYFNASLGKKLISLFIAGTLVWKTVTAAIEFNRELGNRAIEI